MKMIWIHSQLTLEKPYNDTIITSFQKLTSTESYRTEQEQENSLNAGAASAHVWRSVR